MIAGQPGFVEIHAHPPALPADDGDGGNLVHLLDGVVQLRGEAPQIVIAVALAPERQGQNGHIIDRARLNERRREAPGGIRSRSGDIFWRVKRAASTLRRLPRIEYYLLDRQIATGSYSWRPGDQESRLRNLHH